MFTGGNPIVSVCMITYNHAEYIREAIDSVLRQKTTFPVELIIGDDASTDATLDVISQYMPNDGDAITVITREKNVGMVANAVELIALCRGEFIAFLDGDDYWCDTEKLQLQVDLLKVNPKFGMCGAITQILKREEGGPHVIAGQIKPASAQVIFTHQDILSAYIFHTSSVILRRECLVLPAIPGDLTNLDEVIFALCSENRLVGYLPQVVSVYRKHREGVWSRLSASDRWQRMCYTLDFLRKELGGRSLRALARREIRETYGLAASLLSSGSTRESWVLVRRVVSRRWRDSSLEVMRLTLGHLTRMIWYSARTALR